MSLKNTIKKYPALSKIVHWMIQPKLRPKPRFWVKVFLNPLMHKKARSSLICRMTRMDVFPYNKFTIGRWSTIEDYCCVNNGVGNVIIGERTRIGIGSTVIGPIVIGDNVAVAQNVTFSALNHNYQNVHKPPMDQEDKIEEIVIEDDCWIGANSVITAGVKIGKHCVIGGSSVVTKSIEPFTAVVGNPAKPIKSYNWKTETWEKIS